MDDSFGVLRDHYRDRLAAAAAARASGRPVIGYVANTVPVELILAAGAFPLMVAARADAATPHGDRFMEAGLEPETRSLFDQLMSGAFSFLELLILPTTADGYCHLYPYLKEVVRLGEGAMLPPIQLYDLIQSRTEASRAYGLARTRELVRRIEIALGTTLADARLEAAIRVCERVRCALRGLQEARLRGELAGSAAFAAIGAGYFMAPEAFAAALERVQGPPGAGPRLVVVPAEPLYHDRLHAAAEEAGANVVAEDDWWGSRAGGGGVPAGLPPLEAIFEAYWLGAPGERMPAPARESWLHGMLGRPGIDGVVFYMPPSDRTFGWSYPGLRAAVEARGIPALLLRDDVLEEQGREHARAALETFVAGLGRRGGGRP